MKKQIYCNHYVKDKKNSVYSYDLIGSEINLCGRCEKKLRKQILEQNEIENEIK